MRFSKTLALTLCLALSPVLSAQAANPHDKDLQEIHDYALTMDNVKRTYITLFQIKQAVQKDPKLAKAVNADSDDEKDIQDLTAITAKYSSYPAVVAIIANNGMTPRQLVVSELTLIQAGLAAAAVKMGADRDKIIAENSVSPANLDFVIQHQAELDDLGKQYPFQ